MVKIGMIDRPDLIFQRIKFFERFVLEFVAEPGRDVPLLVGPRNRVGSVQDSHRLELFGYLGRRGELQRPGRQRRIRQVFHEFKDPAVGLLMLPERLVVHKQVDHLARKFRIVQPAHVFLGRQRPLRPSPVGKTERDIVAQLEIPQQQVQLLVDRIGIDVIRTFPSQNVLGAFGQHRAEPHRSDHFADMIRIDQFGIAKSRGLYAEFLLHQRTVLLHLSHEFVPVGQRRQRMRIRFGQELDAARTRQRLEAVQHFGRIHPELFDRDPGNRKTDFELFAVFADQSG